MRQAAWIMLLLGLGGPGLARDGGPELTGSALIDHGVRALWKAQGLQPAPAADDAEFMRRAYLDIAGVIPSAAEAEAFLADRAADKRRRLVDRLLKDPRYVDRWADVWNEQLLDYDSKGYYQIRSLKALREIFAANVPFDEFARRVVAAEGVVNYRNLEGLPEEVELAAYLVRERYRSLPFVPQAAASRLTRVFLGIQIQCAQCHDHPFDKWTQEDYLGMVSFFRDLRVVRQKKDGLFHLAGDISGTGNERFIAGMPLIMPAPIDNPGKIPEKASFLGTDKGVEPGLSRRASFARHLTSPENLQFARAAVNRYWFHFFGRGFVDPVDDFNPRNRPTHPELLAALARDFARHGYDLHGLIRSIAGSDAYQRTSRQAPRDPAAERFLAVARVRPLEPEQVLRSVAQATGLTLEDVAVLAGAPDADQAMARMSRAPAAMTAEPAPFRPGSSEYPAEWTAHQHFRYVGGHPLADLSGTITGALLTMNGTVVSVGTALQRRKVLDRILAGGRTPEERSRTVYPATVSRPPTARELERWSAHLKRVPEHEGYEDLMWTMINTGEFLMNH